MKHLPIDGCESPVIVRAFTEQGSGGNRAGVCVCKDFPDPQVMQGIATEMGLSETAFVCPVPGVSGDDVPSFHIRYFTPLCEIELCGHATIAAFGYLFRRGVIAPGTLRIRTRAGDLHLIVGPDGSVLMEQGDYSERDVDRSKYADIARSLGIDCADLDPQIPIAIVSTGVEDMLIAVRSEAVLRDLVPVFSEIEKISNEHEICGYHVVTLHPSAEAEGAGAAALCRNFAPRYGIDEESATGTSNAALAGRLVSLGLWQKGVDYDILQGLWMDRPSRIRVCRKERSWVGGHSEID
ncbi:MAG: PhzF family phenazine biosynthesis protein [Bacillota bacterium]|nr:PhzF family phenazine biosynthesis protein [Bacillota bacterium]